MLMLGSLGQHESRFRNSHGSIAVLSCAAITIDPVANHYAIKTQGMET
jgi:hypothetical protein